MKKRYYTEAELRSIEPYAMILTCLQYGADKAIHLRDMCRYTGLNERAFRKAVEVIRRSGVCIVTSAKGYYLPLTVSELESYIRKTKRTALSTLYTLRAAKERLKELNDTNGKT